MNILKPYSIKEFKCVCPQAGDPGSRGAGDISYIAKYLDCIDGLGASGRGAHAPGETINLKEFPFLVQRAAILIYRLTHSN